MMAYTVGVSFIQIYWQRLQIMLNDLYLATTFSINLICWPFRLICYWSSTKIWVPMLLFMLLLLKKPPNPILDFWHIPTNKSPPPQQPLLYGQHRYLFFSLNSIHNKDHINLSISTLWSQQLYYFQSNIASALVFPPMPRRLQLGLNDISTIMTHELQHFSLSQNIFFKKYLPGLKYLFSSCAIMYFTTPLTQNTYYSLTTAQINDFMTTGNKYEAYMCSFDATASHCTGVLDNSTNVYIINDKSLYTSPILECPLGIDVGTVVGANKPLEIGTAEMI